MDAREIYGKFSFDRLMVWAGVREDFNEPAEEVLTKAFSRIVAIDSRRWIEFLLEVLPRLMEVRFAELPAVQLRMMRMFYITVWQKYMAGFDNEEVLQNLMDLADSPVMLVKMLYMWIVYYNAWENDDCDSAILPLLYHMSYWVSFD